MTLRLRPRPKPTTPLPQTVLIGGSAGSVEALGQILPMLPEHFAAAVVVVVHLPADSASLLVDIFAPRVNLTVQEVHDKVQLLAGNIYFAPPDYHVLVEADGTLALSRDAPVHFCRPAIDVLFETAADALGTRAIGVVLTGANEDGAAGLAYLARTGATTLVQDPKDASMPTMPDAALSLSRVDRVLPAAQIGLALADIVQGKADALR